jgi:hypothetical protein
MPKRRSAKQPTSKDAKKTENHIDHVDAFIDKLEYPLKAEAKAIRKIIKGVNKNITEQIKWNAPSFRYEGYMVTFNLHAHDQLRLVFHNGAILHDDSGYCRETIRTNGLHIFPA